MGELLAGGVVGAAGEVAVCGDGDGIGGLVSVGVALLLQDVVVEQVPAVFGGDVAAHLVALLQVYLLTLNAIAELLGSLEADAVDSDVLRTDVGKILYVALRHAEAQ